MGVPKFYRWLSERYPCLSEVVKENQIPEFDNLYFDMNGIVHTCSHPDDGNVHFRITEEKIFSDIFHYIEVLFRLIKPRKVFYMAIDGCAPRAKMNQQRGRRFRTAKASEEQEKQALAKGEKLPEEKRFDSNCITPGTPFMVRLHKQLQYFISQKVTSDPLWQGIRIYLSGHETPGEGEHKIMDFIRSEKSDTNYDPNTRHCLYGLDADLIILGLITHEPHFSLLREEVRFGKQAEKKRPTSAEETTFHLLHLSLLREYLDAEFKDMKKHDWYDIERVIDDWVFMGFLVGNDFIPHLPDLHINHDALPMLYRAYMEVAPSLNGYINDGGELNLDRLEIYIKHLSKFDTDNFEKVFVDYSFLESKKGNEEAWKSKRVEEKKVLRKKANGNAFELIAIEDDEDEVKETDFFGKAIPKPEVDGKDEIDDGEELTSDEVFEKEFLLHKKDYYKSKFNMEPVTHDLIDNLVRDYVEALQWILYYYFNGVQSWGWYYPHHYAPYMSDLKNFKHLKFEFEKGKPFLPFQQLLGVLPAASKELLPECFQKLMIMDNSPIIDYYPLDFKTDLNGKQQEWEAVVLIPFIDEKRLLSAMDTVANKMTDEERSRNRHGPHLLFSYDVNLQDIYQSPLPQVFPDIHPCRARCTKIPMDKFEIPVEQIRKSLCPDVRLGVYFPGFPTLEHLNYTSKLKNEDVKVFQQISRGENMILTIEKAQADQDLAQLAKDYLGRHFFAEWPHLQEVKVVEVTDDKFRYKLIEDRGKPVRVDKQKMSDEDMIIWVGQVKAIKERYLKRKGVDIGATYVLVHAKPMMGRRYTCGSQGKITLEKEWADLPVVYADHMLVKNISVFDPNFQQFKTLEELFRVDSQCFMLGSPHYGHLARVVEVAEGRIRIEMDVPQEPDFESIINRQQNYEQQYFPGFRMAPRLGISGHLLSRITGSVFIEAESKRRINVGLNLKFNKTNQEIPGFSKKDEQGWSYSSQVQQILVQYMRMFPEVFRVLSQRTNGDGFTEDEIFGDTPRLNELKEWLDEQPCMKVMRVQSGVKQLGEQIINFIEAEVKEFKEKKPKKSKMSVRPHLLFPSVRKMGNLVPDPNGTYELFDRVINVREGYTVPFGLKGTVVGIQPAERFIDTLYDVIFDEEFSGGFCIRCTGKRGYRMPPTALISLSHGLRKGGSDMKPTAVVKPVNTPEHTRHRGWYDNAIAKIGINSPNLRDENVSRKNASPTNQQSKRKDVVNHERLQQRLNKGKQGQSSQNTAPELERPATGKVTILPRKSNKEENKTSGSNVANIQKEFANMWKQLQQSEKPASKTAAPSKSVKNKPSKGSNSAKMQTGVSEVKLDRIPNTTLDKDNVDENDDVALDKNHDVTWNTNDDAVLESTLDKDHDATLDKVDQAALDKDNDVDLDKDDTITLDETTDNEKQLNKDVQKEIYLKKGTEDLCRLLNINTFVSKPESTSNQQSYGKQINVSQLFGDSSNSQASKLELLSPAYFSSPPQGQSHRARHSPNTGHQHPPPGQFTQIPQGQKIYQPQPTHPVAQTGFVQQSYSRNSHSPNQFQWTAGQHVIRGSQPGYVQGHGVHMQGQGVHMHGQGVHMHGHGGQNIRGTMQQPGHMHRHPVHMQAHGGNQQVRGTSQPGHMHWHGGHMPRPGGQPGQFQVPNAQQVRGISQPGQFQAPAGQQLRVSQPGQIQAPNCQSVRTGHPGQMHAMQVPGGQQIRVGQPGQMQVPGGQQIRVGQPGQMQVPGGQQIRVGQMQGYHQGYRHPNYIQNNNRNMPPSTVTPHQPSPQQYQRQPGSRGTILQPRGPPTGPNEPMWTRLPTPKQNPFPSKPSTFIPLQVTKQMTPTKPCIEPVEVSTPDTTSDMQQVESTVKQIKTVLAPVEPSLLQISNTASNSEVAANSAEVSPSHTNKKGQQQRRSRPQKKSVKLAINFNNPNN